MALTKVTISFKLINIKIIIFNLQVQEYKDSLKSKVIALLCVNKKKKKKFNIYYELLNFLFQAEQLIFKGFPEKIVKLNEILETPGFRNKDLKEVHQDINLPIPDPILLNHSGDGPNLKKLKRENNVEDTTGTKVMVLQNGSIECNKLICDLIIIVKPYIRDLLKDSNQVNNFFYFPSN